MKTRQFGHTIPPKRPDEETSGNPETPLVKYSWPLLTCTAVHFSYNVPKNDLISCMHHYLIYYLRKLLWILISGYPGSNIAISSSTSSRASNIFVTPFFLQSPMTYGIRIIIPAPSVGTKNSSMIGHTGVFWIGKIFTGHTMNIK